MMIYVDPDLTADENRRRLEYQLHLIEEDALQEFRAGNFDNPELQRVLQENEKRREWHMAQLDEAIEDGRVATVSKITEQTPQWYVDWSLGPADPKNVPSPSPFGF